MFGPESILAAAILQLAGGLLAGPVGWAIIEGVKKLGLKGRKKIRVAAAGVCSLLTIGAALGTKTLTWEALPVVLLVVAAGLGTIVATGIGAANEPE